MTAGRTTVAGIAIPDSELACEVTEFILDASTRLLFATHGECSSGHRCRRNG
jgi:hypothetical protein